MDTNEASNGTLAGSATDDRIVIQVDASEPRPIPRRRRITIIAFSAFVALWTLLFLASGSLQRGPNPNHLGGDYALLLSGAEVLQSGGNPYNQQVLYRAEKQLLRNDGMSAPRFDPYMRVGNPPWLFWAMGPLTGASFRASAKLWSLGMYFVLALGFLGCLIRMGWRRKWLPLLLFLTLPQTIYAAFYGNVDALVFAALAWSAALTRRRPLAAGVLLSVTFLKPQVALPGAVLIVLFLSPNRGRVIVGFIAATIVLFVLTLGTTGFESVGWWLQALTDYSQRLGVQPDIASLSGLYVYSAPDKLRIAFEAVSLVGVAAVTVVWWHRRRSQVSSVLEVGWLWIAWFLATPFAHFHDEVVLTLPVLAIVGRDAAWLGRWPATLALYALLFSILVFPTSRAHTDFQSLTLVVVLACAVAQLHWRTTGTDSPVESQSMNVPRGDKG